MLLEVMKYCNNFFIKTYEDAEFEIKDNVIKVNGKYIEGQYILITGSLLNNNVYKIEKPEMIIIDDDAIYLKNTVDEVFTGTVYGLAVPKDFIQLVEDIEKYKLKNKDTGIVSHSFGKYSETRATDKNGQVATWQSVYRNRLAKYKMMFNGLNGEI